MIILILSLSVISAILYRAGGMDKQTPHWIPVWMRQSWVRDWLCPFCCLFPMVMITPSWWFILAYVALAGAFSTYWDFLFNDTDNYWFSGFMCGVAAFMLIWCGYAWYFILARAVAVAVLWGGLCALSSNDFFEEYSRGFTVSLSALLLTQTFS